MMNMVIAWSGMHPWRSSLDGKERKYFSAMDDY